MSFNWLHLSDLHLAADDYFDPEIAKKRLFEFLEKEVKSGTIKCDYLFLTGDIANKGNYAGVEDFINRLFKALGWTKDDYGKVFWAIGNHDVHRGNKMRNNLIFAIRKSVDRSKEFEDSMRDKDIKELFTKTGISSYIAYNKKLFNRDLPDVHQRYNLSNLNLIVLNTCIASYNDDDEKKLYIADRTFYNAFEKLDNSKPTFVIGHHSLNFFSDTQQGRLSSTFDDENVDLYLCGHSHNLGHMCFPNARRDVHQIVCGGLKGTSKFSFMHGYYDSETKSVLIKPYSYTQGYQGNWGWRMDNNLHPKLDCVSPLSLTSKREIAHTISAPTKLKTAVESSATSHVTSSKTIGNLPPQNADFTGREDLLQEISAVFDDFSKVLVIGTPGFGKTQLAYEYAYRHKSEYTYVWVMNAEDKPSLESSYRRFAKHHDLPPAETDEFDNVLSHVKHWLNDNTRYLIIFDNVGNTEKVSIDDYLPDEKLSGHIWINTRLADYTVKDAEIINLDVFSLADAMDYLENHLKEREIISSSDSQKLSELLGCHPLALGHAVAYMKTNDCYCSEYIEKLEKQGLKVLEVLPEDYTETVNTTTNFLINRIPPDSATRQLFNICAYFAPDRIPLSMLINGRSVLPLPLQDILEPSKQLEHEKLVKELKRYSLLSWKRDDAGNIVLSIHRLVQEVVRNSLTDVQWKRYCLDVVDKSFKYEYGNLKSMSMFVQCVPHVFQLIRHLGNPDDNNLKEKMARIYIEAGRGFGYDGKYNEALEYLEGKALALRESLGTEHPDTASVYHNIGRVYSRKGDYDNAMGWFKKALAYRERHSEENPLAVAETYHDIARVHARRNVPHGDRQNEYVVALEWYGKALEIRGNAEGEKRIYLAATYNGIAEVNARQGHYCEKMGLGDDAQSFYADAIDGYEKALEIDKEIVGEGHPLTAVTQCNIAAAYYYMKEYDLAETLYDKALPIRENILGKWHPHTALTYTGFAKVYHAKKEYDIALSWYEKALAINKKASDTEDIAIATAKIHFYIGKMCHEEKRYGDALEHFHTALQKQTRWCQDSIDIADTYFSIGESHYSMGNHERALGYYQIALPIHEKFGAPSDFKRVLAAITKICPMINIQKT